MAMVLSVLLLLLLPLHLPSATSEVITTTITNDSRQTIHLADFCFSETGHVGLVLTNVSTTTTPTKPLNLTKIGVHLFQYYGFVPDWDDGCVFEAPYLFRDSFYPVASFDQLSGPPSSGYINRTIKVPKARRYGVILSNCQNETNVSMQVELKLYNVNPDGTRDYLSDALGYLPTDYFVFATFYFLFALVWIYHSWVNREGFHKIHAGMTLLLLTKCLSLYVAGKDKLYESQTGSPHGWDTVFYILYCVRGLLFSTVVMLIGFGWSALKPLLDWKESLVMALGIIIQISLQAIYVLVQERRIPIEPFSNLFWAIGVLDVLSVVAIVIPFQMSLNAFKRSAKADGTAVRTLKLMRTIKMALVATFIYLYLFWTPKLFISMVMMSGSLCMEESEVRFCEVFTAVYYVVLFCLLQPTAEGDYMAVDEELSEEKALEIIKSSEFDI